MYPLNQSVRMVTLKHSGIPMSNRIDTCAAAREPMVTCVVERGADLFTTVEAVLARDGITTAVFKLGKGVFDSLTIMTGGEPPDAEARRKAPVGFCGPHVITAPAQVVGGTGICGLDESDRLTCHSHSVFIDFHGNCVGGHLIPGEAIAGTGGVSVDIVPVIGAAFRRALDQETGFAIFHPVAI